jgi:hypothetical protein
MGLRFKYGLCLVLLVVTCALLWSAYAPEQWLGQIRRFVRVPAEEMPDTIPKPQPPKERIEGRLPNQVVDEIWRVSTQGQLLTPEGWRIAGGFFTEPLNQGYFRPTKRFLSCRMSGIPPTRCALMETAKKSWLDIGTREPLTLNSATIPRQRPMPSRLRSHTFS